MNRANHSSHFKKRSQDQLKTIVNAGSDRDDRDRLERPILALTGRLVADRVNREQFLESFFLTGRPSKRFQLPHGASILTRTQHSLATSRAAKTVEFSQVLLMEEVQKYVCIYVWIFENGDRFVTKLFAVLQKPGGLRHGGLGKTA